ncbi:MAG: beta-ketoacyl-ACP synthase II [Lachnospiraceae bacterium]|nr:beta-ketoacyl-ACP synthase II [Lachnospiraceae bacterium]
MRRVVITGMGAITPIGKNVTEFWEGIKSGKNGIDTITCYDCSDRKVSLAAEVKDFKPEDFLDKRDARRMDKFTQFALIAAREAFADSGLKKEEEDPAQMGVIISSGIGGIKTIEEEERKGGSKGYDRVSPFFIPMAISNMAAGSVAIDLGLQGMCTSVITACASGTNAIGDGFRHIKHGYAKVMLCGGSEASITPLGMGGFTSLQALNTTTEKDRASIPFDKERSGFVMGEGAGVLVLEEYEHAKNRGAKIYAEVIGYGANCDAHHMTAPLEDGSGAAACMELALKEGEVAPEAIHYINAHGTSTPLNDKGETKAIKTVFKDHAYQLAVSSTKSMTGHLLGASGAVEGIVTALSVYHDFIPPTINYRTPDEECDLDIVPNEGRNKEVVYAMSNSLGFGGHNATILLKKYIGE